MADEATKLSEEMLDEILTAFRHLQRINQTKMSLELEEYLTQSSGLTKRVFKEHCRLLGYEMRDSR